MQLISAISALAVISGASATTTNSHVARDKAADNVNGPYVPTTAPRDNLWAGISSDEASSIREFLARQSNVTMHVESAPVR
jgi:hypothetical protein